MFAKFLLTAALAASVIVASAQAGILDLTAGEREVVAALNAEPQTAIELWQKTGVSPKRIGQAMTKAKLVGYRIKVGMSRYGMTYSSR